MILLMITKEHFYPIESSGKKPILEEAADHGRLNDHVMRVETLDGQILWKRDIQ